MTNTEIYVNETKTNEVIHFFNQISAQLVENVYFIKILNESKNSLILNKLKKILDSKWSLRLAFLRSDEPYNFDKLDRDGFVDVCESYYEIYLVTDTDRNSYFVIIQKNNFFPNGNNVELAFTKRTDYFSSLFYRLFYSSIN
jgi:hypothetical protein